MTEDPDAATLAEAVTYLQSLYKDAVANTPRDYDMPAKVMIGSTQFTVTWKVSVDTITVKESSKSGFMTIDVPDKNETEFKYVLTATVKDSAGKTQEISFNRVMPVVNNDGSTELFEGKEYKMYMIQVTVGKVLYAIAETQDDKYLKSTDDASKAASFKVEKVEDGYKIYTEINGAKNYIYAHTVPYDDGSGKMSKYLCYSTENASVWTYQQNVNAWFTTCEGTTYVMGTYSNFETFCISESTYINATNSGVTQFPAEFLESGKDAPELPKPDANDPAADSTLTVKEAIDLGASKISDQYTTGKYYVTGVITEVYNETYGNMRISDSEGNILTVYGTYSADGSARYDAMDVKPVAGDTVKVYGIIGQYNDDPQMKNGWIVEHTPGEGTETPDPKPETNEQGGTDTVPATLAEQIAAAAKLANDTYLNYESTITGTITDTPQASSYTAGAYKFTVSDGTNSLLCYFVPVTGGTPAKGDTVTVTGKLTAYNGTAQFDETAAATVTKSSDGEGGNTQQPTAGATALNGTLTDGMKIVIVNGANKKALSSDPSAAGSYYQKGVDVVISGNTVTGYGTAEIWTVVVNGDGSYSFK